MSADPNKKSARTFQCRDVLWETFEQMARELECSIDYLINESMKQYARQRSYSPRTPFPGPVARNDGSNAQPPPMAPNQMPQAMAAGGAMGYAPHQTPPPMPAGMPPQGYPQQMPMQQQNPYGQYPAQAMQGMPLQPGMQQPMRPGGPPPPPPPSAGPPSKRQSLPAPPPPG